jgi:hypothetical protein
MKKRQLIFFQILIMIIHAILGTYHINPIDKIIALYDEKIALYERILKDKEVMIEELKRDEIHK